ncbi:hypothetical protein UFOVP27_43 [uncultured Caudovirales phage]|jgi:hypothetical protein|uniref:Uncharacterized protein n=1 Tax=uncultured Caudovirales phage TaxID=2100421 RepID=A0A6J5KK49_9CAUD|nr:hypothetical protein UFOVP27_43 [uncultured Caudovirales phage]
MSYDAPEIEDFDGEDHSHAHKDGKRLSNLGHGSKCIECNDAVMKQTEQGMGRIASFKIGSLEHKMSRKYSDK